MYTEWHVNLDLPGRKRSKKVVKSLNKQITTHKRNNSSSWNHTSLYNHTFPTSKKERKWEYSAAPWWIREMKHHLKATLIIPCTTTVAYLSMVSLCLRGCDAIWNKPGEMNWLLLMMEIKIPFMKAFVDDLVAHNQPAQAVLGLDPSNRLVFSLQSILCDGKCNPTKKEIFTHKEIYSHPITKGTNFDILSTESTPSIVEG